MKRRKLIYVLVGLAGALGALSAFYLTFWRADVRTAARPDKKQVSKANGPKPKGKGAEARPRKAGRVDAPNEEAKLAGEETEPSRAALTPADDDESRLNEEQRKTLVAIREALSYNDRKAVLRIVQSLQKSEEWPDGVPKLIKLEAVDALGWFGSSCLPELAGFLADADKEVVQSAIDRYQEMLADFDLSDFERAEILVQAAKVIDDADAMDPMLFELNNMRRSVAINTVKRLMVEGTAAAKSVLPENVAFLTGEEGLDSAQKLDDWLARNPDDDGDEELYGNSGGK